MYAHCAASRLRAPSTDLAPKVPDMGTALIAAFAALAGVIVGGFLTARREHRHWLREQRRAAYVDMLESSHALSLSASGSADAPTRFGQEAMLRMTSAYAAVELTASDAVEQSSSIVQNAAWGVHLDEVTRDHFTLTWLDFRSKARRDLGIEPLSIDEEHTREAVAAVNDYVDRIAQLPEGER